MYLFRPFWAAVTALCLMIGAANGQVDGTPAGPVILTVSGLNEADFPGGQVHFDIDILRAMGEVEIETSSIWTDGTHVYTGVLLKDLVETLKIGAGLLRLRALNDYAVEFPAHEAGDDGPILAYWSDGKPMPVRDKGPVWLIYPYDSKAEYRTDTAYSRSIWQLDRIEVLR